MACFQGRHEHRPLDYAALEKAPPASLEATRYIAAIRSSSLAKSSPMNKAPGLKLSPCPINTGPFGPSILIGFVQAQAPVGSRWNLWRRKLVHLNDRAPRLPPAYDSAIEVSAKWPSYAPSRLTL